MEILGVMRISWICVLLFSIGTCVPIKKGQTAGGSGSDSDSGAPGLGSGYGSAYGSGVTSGLGSGYGSAYGGGVTSGLGSGYGSAYGSGVTSGLGSGYGSAYGSGVTSGLGSGYGSAYGSGVTSGLGSGSGSTSGLGSGSFSDSLNDQDADLARFFSSLMNFKIDRPIPQFAWTSAQVPLGMVEKPPIYPASHIIQSSNGYQRARDSRSHAKYSQDTFDHIPVDGYPGSTGQKSY